MVNRIYLVILILVFSAGCSINPVTGQQDFVLMSEQEELALGRQHSRQVMKTYRLYDNPALQQYIQSVGDRVARVSHRQSLIYRFTLLDSPQVNAFALPGGYIYITRGLLAYLNSEAELAAVLGHELGHVTARHSVRQHSLSTATHLIGGLIAAASGVQGAGQLSNILGTSIVRGYGREHELEADGLGADYLRKAGYSAAAMRRVIAVLKNQELFDKKLAAEQGREPRAYHGVFSTHPDNDTRLQQVLGHVGPVVNSSGTQKQDIFFLKKIEGLTFGDSEKDGIIRGRRFYHPELNFKLDFPSDWLISNKPDSITAITPNNDAFMQLRLEDLNKK
jgi:Putative Zn-dependent protease